MKKYIKYFLILLCFISFVKIITTQMFYKNIYYEEKKTITGKITDIKKDKDKITFDIKSNSKFYMGTIYDEFNYELGDVIKISGTFYTASDNTVFNLFNYRKYLLSKNISMLIKPSKIEFISKNKNIFYIIKNIMIRHVDKYKSKAYLKTFLLGDSSDIEKSVKDNYQILGVSHLMAVSGMHVTTIILIFNNLLKKRKFKSVFIFIFLSFFLFLTNFTISLTRALLFLFFKKLNDKIGLGLKTYLILILTAFILLLFNSYLVYNVGFVFSVVISFFIILIGKRLKYIKGYFKKTALVSVTAFFASVPIIASNFFKINLLSPIFNIILVPFISLIIFPFSLIVFIFPFLDSAFMVLIKLLESLTLLFSNFRILNFIISKPNIIFIVIYYLLLFLSIKINFKYIISFALVMIININSRFFIVNPQLTFLDVGQGDCSILILPAGKCVIFDTGGSAFKSGSISKNKIVPFLNSMGINDVECLILTHGDSDHMGEASSLIKNINIKNIIINKGDVNNLERQLIKQFKPIKANDKYCFKKYELLFLNDKTYNNNENKNSIVIFMEILNNKIMLMGDADKDVEKNILRMYNLPNLDILKVGHHGSNTSSCNEFISVTDPLYAVISVGQNNNYGHPHKETLDTLKKSTILRTDKTGSIRFVFRRNMVNKYTCKPYIIVER